MQRKRQETTAELADKFYCVHNRNIFCIKNLKFRVMGRGMHDILGKWVGGA